MKRRALITAIAVLALPATAGASRHLSIVTAKRAVQSANPHAQVDHCKRLSAARVRCHLAELEVSMPTTATGMGTITLIEGTATVTREESGILRVHYGGGK